jgi:hypothetical protein
LIPARVDLTAGLAREKADVGYRTGMAATSNPRAGLWIPRQHGAWPMLAVPLLMGVAISRPDPWQIVLGVAAVAGYLVSSTAQVWRRAKNRDRYHRSLAVFGAALAVSGLALVAIRPALALALLVLVPMGIVTLVLSRPGRPRGIVEGLAQVGQALVLVPAAASVADSFESRAVLLAALAAGLYLAGTVFLVRSVIRERGNARYAALSVAYHLAATVVAFALLPVAFGVLFAAVLVRSVAMPVIERRLSVTAKPLRPVHVGMIEMVASIALVGIAFAIGV